MKGQAKKDERIRRKRGGIGIREWNGIKGHRGFFDGRAVSVASKSYSWIRSSFESRVRARFGAPKLVRRAFYIAINITRKLGRFEKKKRKEEGKEMEKKGTSRTPSRTFPFTALSPRRMDNFVLNHGIYREIFFSLFYRGISLPPRGRRRVPFNARNIARCLRKSESTAEKHPSLIDRATQIFALNVSACYI